MKELPLRVLINPVITPVDNTQVAKPGTLPSATESISLQPMFLPSGNYAGELLQYAWVQWTCGKSRSRPC